MPTINGRFGPISREENPNFWAPLISVSIAKYETTSALQNDLTALIDTGAQMCMIDKDVAKSIGLSEGVGGSALLLGHEAHSSSYLTALLFPEMPYQFNVDLLGGDFASVPFKVILGWDFLRRFNLTLSRKNGLVRLDWIGE
jgi:hypothetical protein